MTTTAPARTNKFGAKCADCGGWVAAGAGTLAGSRGAWVTRHIGTCPAPKAAAKAAEPGYYVKADGTMLVVVENKAKTRTYAKRLVVTTTPAGKTKASWEYAPGEAASVAEVTPMTLTDAAAFGHAHGVCMVCCRTLTNPESVKAGIGPSCAKRF